jgi:hypothetical protein
MNAADRDRLIVHLADKGWNHSKIGRAVGLSRRGVGMALQRIGGPAWACAWRMTPLATPRTEAELDRWLKENRGVSPRDGRGRPPSSGRPSSVVPLSRPDKPGAQGPCLEDGCGARVYARGRCRKHYRSYMHANRTEEQREFDREYGKAGNITKVTGQVVAGSQGWPSASMTKVSKKFRPCLAAVDR